MVGGEGTRLLFVTLASRSVDDKRGPATSKCRVADEVTAYRARSRDVRRWRPRCSRGPGRGRGRRVGAVKRIHTDHKRVSGKMRPHSSYSREFAKSDISVTNVLPTSVAEGASLFAVRCGASSLPKSLWRNRRPAPYRFSKRLIGESTISEGNASISCVVRIKSGLDLIDALARVLVPDVNQSTRVL